MAFHGIGEAAGVGYAYTTAIPNGSYVVISGVTVVLSTTAWSVRCSVSRRALPSRLAPAWSRPVTWGRRRVRFGGRRSRGAVKGFQSAHIDGA